MFKIKKAQNMSTPIFSLIPSEQQAKWDDIMSQMCAFVNDTNADVDMAYDWVCEMLNISSFVDNNTAWDSFYETWESCDNRNDMQYNFAWFFTLTCKRLNFFFTVNFIAQMVGLWTTVWVTLRRQKRTRLQHVSASILTSLFTLSPSKTDDHY